MWKRYLDSKPEIDEIFDKFDVNKSGKLEADQLKAFLTELNDGIAPSDDEVKWVLESADGAVDGSADDDRRASHAEKAVAARRASPVPPREAHRIKKEQRNEYVRIHIVEPTGAPPRRLSTGHAL